MTDRWIAAFVRNGRESEVSEEASELGWECYCPHMTFYRRVPRHRVAKVGSSRERITAPIFPGYVFMRHDMDDSISRLANLKGIVTFIRNRDQLCHARDEDMQRLKALVLSGFYRVNDPDAQASGLTISFADLMGNRVVVNSGVLEGLSGVAVQECGDYVHVDIGARKVMVAGQDLRLA